MNSTLLTEEPCRKFMSKYDTQNYFRQFRKTLSLFFSEIQHKQKWQCVTAFDINN